VSFLYAWPARGNLERDTIARLTLEDAMAALDEEGFGIIERRFLDEETRTEVAAALGRTRAEVRSVEKRARRKMRRWVGEV
jgi:DNA-directed RNA polymerase specialized sigma24 family protein